MSPRDTAGGVLHFGTQAIPWRPGESVAVALLNAGVVASRRSVSGQARQAFCGMGVCHECRVVVNGQRVLGCQTPCEHGLQLAPVEREAEHP